MKTVTPYQVLLFIGAAAVGAAATPSILSYVAAHRLAVVQGVLIALPIIFGGLYLFLQRRVLRDYVAFLRSRSAADIVHVMKRNWDVLLILLLVSLLFLYRLQTWNIIILEEWRRYVQFIDGNWLDYRSGHKLNSIFLPTYLIASLFPFDSVVEYRIVTGGLSAVGGVLFYLAVRKAAQRRMVAALATLLLVTHTWIQLFGRMFFVSWSALTLSSLSLLIFFRLRERGMKATALVNGISVLNFAQAVFFVFPFLIMERLQERNTVTLRQSGVSLLLIGLLLVPAFFHFMSEQPRRVNEEHAIYGEDPVAHVTIPGAGKQIYWPVSVSETVKVFHDYLSITDAPRLYPTFRLGNRYGLLTLILFLYPLLALRFSRWEYRYFFAGGAWLSVATIIGFPMTVNPSYTWAFFLFLAPLLAEGSVKSPYRMFRVVSLVLLLTVVVVQGVDTFDDIILYDVETSFDSRIGTYIENETILVDEELPPLIKNSPLDPLRGHEYIPVESCLALRRTTKPVLVADPFCGAGPDNTLVNETHYLFLYR